MPDDPSAAKGAGSQVAAPSSSSATSSGQSQINVGWQDNSADESQFQVHRSIGGPAGAFVLRGSTGPNVTTYRDEGLAAGTQYCYMIRAVRVKGITTTFSPFSVAACAVTDSVPVPPPTPVAAPSAATAATASAMNSPTIDVRWTALTSPETQFRIERSTDGGASWTLAGTSPPSDRWFSDSDPQIEQTACYRVVAFNSSGTASPSNTACATPPAPPTSLSVTLVDAQTLSLAWTDNSAVEDGYEVTAFSIYAPCCGSEGGGGTGCASGYGESDYVVTRLPAGTTSYRTPVDPLLAACNTTVFEVRAMNGASRSAAATSAYGVAP